jgi:2-iminoacetate synthase ThiH
MDGSGRLCAANPAAAPSAQGSNEKTMATTTMQGEKWTLSAIADLYDAPLLDLVFRAAEVHRRYHDPREVQLCTLLSIKTGNCPEDCAYCPQSSRYETEVDPGRMMKTEEVLAAAREAKEAGSTRFCMGAAWREVTDGRAFDRVLEIVRGVRGLGMEACCTLGMLTEDQARRLAEAGLSSAGRGRAVRLQPQPRYVRGILRPDHHHADLRGSADNDRQRRQGRHLRLLRRHPRPRRGEAGPD